VCVDFPAAVTVASVTGRGGHGWPGRSTGHVGPATTEPETPEPVDVDAPGVTGGCVVCGPFVGHGVEVAAGAIDAVARVADADAPTVFTVFPAQLVTRSATVIRKTLVVPPDDGRVRSESS
jgi:hypothetical protein